MPRFRSAAHFTIPLSVAIAALVGCGADGGSTPSDHAVVTRVREANSLHAIAPTPTGSMSGWPQQEEPPQPTGVVHDISMDGDKFTPVQIRIEFGDSVRFHFPAEMATVTSGLECNPDGIFDSDVHQAPYAYTVTFLRPGIYGFYNAADCSMGGAVVVNPPNTAQ